jgi:hypothetical protein
MKGWRSEASSSPFSISIPQCLIYITGGIFFNCATCSFEFGRSIKPVQVGKAKPHSRYEQAIIKILCELFVYRTVKASGGCTEEKGSCGSQSKAEEKWV